MKTNFPWWLVVIIGVVLIVAGLMIPITAHLDKARAECEARGGVYFHPRDGEICLRKDAVLEF